jgi:hypothetical protein
MTATSDPALTPSLDSSYLDFYYSRLVKARQEVQCRRLDVRRANDRFRRNPSRMTRRRVLAAYTACDWAETREHFAGVDYDTAVAVARKFAADKDYDASLARKRPADDEESRYGVFTAPRNRS